MKVIYANNPDHGLETALRSIIHEGATCDSRNGPVLRFRTPVTSVYNTPRHRVSFNKVRDANPFLHLMESLWMLAGRNDVEFAAYYAKQMLQYTDDGKTLNGAYGYRWRKHFGYDQLEAVIEELKKTKGNSRRCVIQMWDASRDFYPGEDSWAVKRESDLLNQTSKDLPCNTALMFDAQLGHLDMTVVNRSNDTIWGCYGANAVHFSFLLEYMADRIGIPVGTYYQVSNNLHAYLEFDITKRFIAWDQQTQHATIDDDAFQPEPDFGIATPYTAHLIHSMALNAGITGWDDELHHLVDNYRTTEYSRYSIAFFDLVAAPMCAAYNCYKSNGPEAGLAVLSTANEKYKRTLSIDVANDWILAGARWLRRRPSINRGLSQPTDFGL
jgi:thymidylate synthase